MGVKGKNKFYQKLGPAPTGQKASGWSCGTSTALKAMQHGAIFVEVLTLLVGSCEKEAGGNKWTGKPMVSNTCCFHGKIAEFCRTSTCFSMSIFTSRKADSYESVLPWIWRAWAPWMKEQLLSHTKNVSVPEWWWMILKIRGVRLVSYSKLNNS